jgi:hypothetical protein
MREWLARFAFTLFVLAMVCAWEGYRIQRGDRGNPSEHQLRMYALYAAAALCFGLGLRGMQERHRVRDERDESTSEGSDQIRKQ